MKGEPPWEIQLMGGLDGECDICNGYYLCIAAAFWDGDYEHVLHFYAEPFIAHEIKNALLLLLYCKGFLHTLYVSSKQIYAMTKGLVAAAFVVVAVAALVWGIQASSVVALALLSSLDPLASLDQSVD